MSQAVVERATTGRLVVTIPTAADGLATRKMDIRGFRHGHVLIPSAWTAADLAFLSADTEDPTAILRGDASPADIPSATPAAYTLIRTAAASAPLLRLTNIPTGTAGWMPLPDALFYGHAFIKVFSVNTASEAAVQQGGARDLIFRFSS